MKDLLDDQGLDELLEDVEDGVYGDSVKDFMEAEFTKIKQQTPFSDTDSIADIDATLDEMDTQFEESKDAQLN